jgi:hypothetical protein
VCLAREGQPQGLALSHQLRQLPVPQPERPTSTQHLPPYQTHHDDSTQGLHGVGEGRWAECQFDVWWGVNAIWSAKLMGVWNRQTRGCVLGCVGLPGRCARRPSHCHHSSHYPLSAVIDLRQGRDVIFLRVRALRAVEGCPTCTGSLSPTLWSHEVTSWCGAMFFSLPVPWVDDCDSLPLGHFDARTNKRRPHGLSALAPAV